MNRRLGPVVAIAVLATLLVPGTAAAARPSRTLFSEATPGTYSWVVPKGVKKATFELYGAQGGGVDGGYGGKTTATINVQPGQVIEIVIGGRGAADGTGGFNGGGLGSTYFGDPPDVGPGGGGATDVRVGACAATLACGFADRIIVAGGGGGDAAASSGASGFGGAGGGLSGDAGTGLNGGAAGTQSSAGLGGGGFANLSGQFGIGGYGGAAPSGGGGGGWFGGGGGAYISGGGGGSGFVSGLAVASSMASGIQSGNGVAVIRSGS